MNGVPSQWSLVALWADVRVIGVVMLLCAVGLGVLWTVCFGIQAALTALGSAIAQIGRAVRLR